MSSTADLDDVGKNATLYKKYLGYANTGLTIGQEFQTSATPNVFNKNILVQDIPDIAPTTNQSQAVQYYNKLSGLSPTTQYSYTKKWNSSIPHLVKYEDVQLTGFAGNPQISFIFQETNAGGSVIGENILRRAIPTNFDAGGTYGITLKQNGATIPIDKYIFDRDAGIISFYNYDSVSQNNPPEITFWRYEGQVGISSIVGPTGAKGDAGLQGPTGAKGDAGLQGPTGAKGDAGLQGPTGAKGDAGLQGPTGAKGDAGLQGPTGAKGDAGLQGPTGAKGDAGLQGPTGAKGDAGLQGPTGAKGDAGLQGPTGAKGDAGLQGPTGAKGDAGLQGPTGAKGDAGLQGPTGAKGDAGLQGPTGAKGDAGLQGPTGAKGDAGLQGPTGAKGDAGLQGPTGAKGDVGGMQMDFTIPTSLTTLRAETFRTLIKGFTDNTLLLATDSVNNSRIASFNISTNILTYYGSTGISVTGGQGGLLAPDNTGNYIYASYNAGVIYTNDGITGPATNNGILRFNIAQNRYETLGGGIPGCRAFLKVDSANNVYVGCGFNNVNSNNTPLLVNGIAKWSENGPTGTNGWEKIGGASLIADGSGNFGVRSGVLRKFYVDNQLQEEIYIAGFFTGIDVNGTTLPINKIARYNITTNTWSSLGGTWDGIDGVYDNFNTANGISIASIHLNDDNKTLYITGNTKSVKNSSGDSIDVNYFFKYDLELKKYFRIYQNGNSIPGIYTYTNSGGIYGYNNIINIASTTNKNVYIHFTAATGYDLVNTIALSDIKIYPVVVYNDNTQMLTPLISSQEENSSTGLAPITAICNYNNQIYISSFSLPSTMNFTSAINVSNIASNSRMTRYDGRGYNVSTYPTSENPTLTLYKGLTYYFNLTNISQNFALLTTSLSPYTDGVTFTSDKAIFTIPENAPTMLYYTDNSNGYRGGIIKISSLVGPAGPTGAQGSTGPKGEPGNNQVYNDAWFQNNLFSMPPAPTYIETSVFATSTEIGFRVTNPSQVPFGNMLVPYIDNIRITLGNTGPSLNVLNDSNDYLPYKSKKIEGIILSKIGTTSYGPMAIKGTPNIPTYRFAQSDIGSYTEGGKIYVNIWFNNTVMNGNPNKLTVPLDAFMEAFPPSVPLNIAVTPVGATGANITWSAPQFTSGTTNDANITNYRVMFNNISSPNRYPAGGYTTVDSSTIDLGNVTNNSLTNLKPGTVYNIRVAAKNDINASYGPSGPVDAPLQFTTNVPTAPTVPTLTLSLPTSNYFTTANGVKRLSDGSVISQPIYTGTATGNFNPITNVPIHRSTNVGSTGANLMNLKMFVNGTEHYGLSFGGFGTTEVVVTDIPGRKIILNRTVKDYTTTTNFTNFYNVCDITPALTLGNGGNMPAGSAGNTGHLNYAAADGSTAVSSTQTFYVDDLVGAPIITSASFTDSFTSLKLTGITIVGSITAQNIPYNINCRNVARYFARNDKVVEITSTVSGINFSVTTNATIPNTSVPIDTNIVVNFTGNVNVTFTGSILNYGIPFRTTAFNTVGTAGTSVNTTTTLNKLVDKQSFDKMIKISIPNVGNVGCRVANQSPLAITASPATFNYGGNIFNNDNNILSTNELPIITGKYASRAFNPTYLQNTPTFGGVDYSSMVTETDFRYVTFAWNITMSNTNTLNILQFNFVGFNANGNITRDSNNSKIETNNKFKVFYRFEELEGVGVKAPSSNTPPTSSDSLTSYWIDANITSPTFNYNLPASNGTLGGLLYDAGDMSPINHPNSSDFTYNVQTQSVTPYSSGKSGIKIYLMVGIKMDANISFTDVICNYT